MADSASDQALLHEILHVALESYGGNMSALARRLDRTVSPVTRWYSGQSKPDFEACLALAAITRTSPERVLRAAGHEPKRLQEVRELLNQESAAVAPRIPIQVEQDALQHSYRRWMEVMGPRLGEGEAHELFWRPFLAQAASQEAQARAIESAINPASARPNKPVVKPSAGRANREDPADDGPLSRVQRLLSAAVAA